MLRGLWQLTWLEIKIFVREPLGVIGTVAVPVLFFVALGRMFRGRLGAAAAETPRVLTVDLPILASMLIALSGVLSLVTIVSIYREGRNPEAPARHAASAVHDSERARHRQVDADGSDVWRDDAGRPALLSRRRRRAHSGVQRRAALQHRVHPVDRLPDRQRRPHGALRAADWLDHPVSDAGLVRAVCRHRRPAARAAAGLARCCRSPTRCRCCEASGTARVGGARRRRGLCWRWCLWRARPCRPKCFGGSNVVVCGGE